MSSILASALALSLLSAGPKHPVDENPLPAMTGPQYQSILTAIKDWPKRRLGLATGPSSASVKLVAYETPGREHAIGIGQFMRVAAPLETVRQVMEDFDHYKDLFFDFKDVHLEERDGNRVVTFWEQSIPIPFVPNTKYATWFYILDGGADRVFYRYQLKSSNSLTYSDGLMVLERDGPQATIYTEYDFFDASWGIAATFAPARIWRDSLKGIYDSDIAIKLRAEHKDWDYGQVRRESKRLWEEEYPEDTVGDVIKAKRAF
jgi:hypothetical protein